MKLDVTQSIKQLNGKDLMDTAGPCATCGRPRETEKVTVRGVLCNALVSARQGQNPIEGKIQVEQYELALRIQREDEVDLSTQDAAELQELVASMYTPLITGQIWHLLEGE